MSRTVKPIRCPKCRSIDVFLREWCEWYTDWWPDVLVEEGEGYHETGSYTRAEGICNSCKHDWKLRGEFYITEDLKDRLRVNHKMLQEKNNGIN